MKNKDKDFNIREDEYYVEMKREPVVIPTYIPHAPDKNPIFHEKRSYQGASGRIYPIPVTDKLSHEKVDKEFDSVTLENDTIKIMVLPEVGGRIHIGLDKTNDYNFIYHNTVIKPALIGTAGPWISGGIEFNWPQHHRPTTFMPLETTLEENADGSKTVWMGEVEPLYRTKSMTGITVYPGRSYLKVKARAYNRTSTPQQFMWWANLGVHVNEDYRIVFPPDVKYMAFHDKAFISEYPILKGKYADIDFDEGLDGTWFKNFFAAGSFMVMDGTSQFDFVEGYDMGEQAGIIHIGNHHISPGKKLFTWGNGDFGQGWKRNLTDNDGHYVELMTGMYTDNQPDFSWMQPNESRTFEHCWYPIKNIGLVKNATEDAAVSLEVREDKILLGFHTTGHFPESTIVLKFGDEVLLQQTIDINAADPFLTSVNKPEGLDEYQLWTAIYSSGGQELVSYKADRYEASEIPKPRKPSPEPEDIDNNEELYIHGLHIEQYRHHSLTSNDYFEEALSRDPNDIRCNNAMGIQSLKQGMFIEAEEYFKRAMERLMSRDTNPYDGEALYNLGIVQKYMGKYEDAYNAFYKATWNYSFKSASYHCLAELDCRKGDYTKALHHISQSLLTNFESIRSRDLKSAVLRKMGSFVESEALSNETLKIDLLDHWARFERYFTALNQGNNLDASHRLSEITQIMKDKAEAYIDIAIEYSNMKMFEEAMMVLEAYVQSCQNSNVYPMVYYYQGYISALSRKEEKAMEYFILAEGMNSDYCFPNRLESIVVLSLAQRLNPYGSKASYYLGNLFYDKLRFDDAIMQWEKSRELNDGFSIVHRNLALAYFDKNNDFKQAKHSMEKAFSTNPRDARLLYELLQLYKNSECISIDERLSLIENHEDLIMERNDCYVEVLALYLQKGLYDEGIRRLENHIYDIYEGGEGKLVKVHEWLHILKALQEMELGAYDTALHHIEAALILPEYFHEQRTYAAGTCHIYYYGGVIAEMQGNHDKAQEYYTKALLFKGGIGEAAFYQGLAYRKLHMDDKAQDIFHNLITAGDKQIQKGGKYDYFKTGVPTPPPFENNRLKYNMSEGLYLKSLGYLGLQSTEKGLAELENVLKYNSNHLGAWIHSRQGDRYLVW